MLNLALFQQDIIHADAAANQAKVAAALCRLEQKVDVVVVPETFTTGFGDHMAALAEPEEGPTLDFARGLAARHDALIIGTWTVRTIICGTAGVANRLHWVYPDGTYGFYDKAHTFRASSEAGQLLRGRERALFEWRGWRIKPAVCYDLRFPTWLRNTRCEEGDRLLGYDLLVVCANWPASRSEAWSTLLRARAIENLCYVAGVNRVGTDDAGIEYSGDSAAVDYKGLPMTQAAHGCEELLTASLDKEALETFRQHWPFHLDFD
ncbi:MAG: nitrilase family protein [Bacteroidales bacterium]|nr:nitrilase family protein [Bacteroidales bacterium]